MSDRRIRVLVVDDLPRVRDALLTLLTTHPDLDVAGAAVNGSDALDQARLMRPDVVLMDLEMPVLDGCAATRAIVAENLAAVVILSIHTDPATRQRCHEAGAAAFLEKGACADDLLHTLVRAGRSRRRYTCLAATLPARPQRPRSIHPGSPPPGAV